MPSFIFHLPAPVAIWTGINAGASSYYRPKNGASLTYHFPVRAAIGPLTTPEIPKTEQGVVCVKHGEMQGPGRGSTCAWKTRKLRNYTIQLEWSNKRIRACSR